MPPAFTCIHCHNAINMESMLLRPTEGVDEERTNVAVIPWTQRSEIGKFRAMFRTIRMSLFQPAILINASTTFRLPVVKNSVARIA